VLRVESLSGSQWPDERGKIPWVVIPWLSPQLVD
jgi:hypothetical protein